MPGAVKLPLTPPEADTLLRGSSVVVNFCASWAEPCAHLNTVFSELAEEHTSLSFVQLDADVFPDLCERFKLESVPAFLFLHAGALTDSVMGADVPSLVNKVKQHSLTAAIASPGVAMLPTASAPATSTAPAPTKSAPAAPAAPLEERLKALLNQAPVVLFMKGSPDAPRCGFSRQAVEVLRKERVSFASFDILGDEEVRQGLKTFSNWPTYPQLYSSGKLVGGLDIMKELHESGDLAAELPAAARPPA